MNCKVWMGRWKKWKLRHKDTMAPGGPDFKWITFIYRKQDTPLVTQCPCTSCPCLGPGCSTGFIGYENGNGVHRPSHFSSTNEETEAWWEMLRQKLTSPFLKLPLNPFLRTSIPVCAALPTTEHIAQAIESFHGVATMAENDTVKWVNTWTPRSTAHQLDVLGQIT